MTSSALGVSHLMAHLNSRSFPRRELLYFDQVALLDMDRGLQAIHDSGMPRYYSYAERLEWLVGEGLLIRQEVPSTLEGDLARDAAERALEAARHREAALREAAVQRVVGDEDEFYRLHASAIRSEFDEAGFAVRAVALELTSSGKVDAIPLVRPNALTTTSGDASNARTDTNAVRIVINALPMPDAGLPWEELLAFRAEPETRAHLLGLRRWTRRIAREGLSGPAIAEEIEHQIHEYQHYMTLQRIKYSRGAMEVVLSFAAEVIEDAAKFRLKQLVGSVFSLQRRHVDLLEAEQRAPGREVAYLVHATQLANH